MSEQAVLAIVGLLITALFAIGGFVIRAMWAKLVALERGQQSSQLSAFIARFDATERSWDVWRAGLENDRKSLHSSHERRLDAHAQDLKDHGNRITRLERNGH